MVTAVNWPMAWRLLIIDSASVTMLSKMSCSVQPFLLKLRCFRYTRNNHINWQNSNKVCLKINIYKLLHKTRSLPFFTTQWADAEKILIFWKLAICSHKNATCAIVKKRPTGNNCSTAAETAWHVKPKNNSIYLWKGMTCSQTACDWMTGRKRLHSDSIQLTTKWGDSGNYAATPH